jgi:hypothetical protein
VFLFADTVSTEGVTVLVESVKLAVESGTFPSVDVSDADGNTASHTISIGVTSVSELAPMVTTTLVFTESTVQDAPDAASFEWWHAVVPIVIVVVVFLLTVFGIKIHKRTAANKVGVMRAVSSTNDDPHAPQYGVRLVLGRNSVLEDTIRCETPTTARLINNALLVSYCFYEATCAVRTRRIQSACIPGPTSRPYCLLPF